ncbi:hypothetical protein Slin15195_G129600 [Septoria linicola]|uniref:Uncharacterized protein n=1 Tax=Septoria linicola TaxID=215465 RepID=A0A9Q9EQB5_9PEZI|nr:hypothetical protein Slin15195_G129600 [Septoria linicola]
MAPYFPVAAQPPPVIKSLAAPVDTLDILRAYQLPHRQQTQMQADLLVHRKRKNFEGSSERAAKRSTRHEGNTADIPSFMDQNPVSKVPIVFDDPRIHDLVKGHSVLDLLAAKMQISGDVTITKQDPSILEAELTFAASAKLSEIEARFAATDRSPKFPWNVLDFPAAQPLKSLHDILSGDYNLLNDALWPHVEASKTEVARSRLVAKQVGFTCLQALRQVSKQVERLAVT